MTRPRILDLYAGEGLVAEGLRAAGWEPWGVDIIDHSRRYPGPFLVADATKLTPSFIRGFDAVWASPPCLRDTAMRHAKGAKGLSHPEMIGPTRRLLQASGKPYIIENVETAPLQDPVILCGSMFDLGVEVDGRRYHLKRHRKFETNWPLSPPRPCVHLKPVVTILGGHARVRSAKAGGRGTADFVGHRHRDVMGAAMGVSPDRDLTCTGISDGIPPPYARWVGEQLLEHLEIERCAA